MRDYAILVLLARLGLRAGEVVSLTLDDIDWRADQLQLRCKGRRSAQVPLISEVGDALARYVQSGRPRCATRRIFMRGCAPRVGFANSSAICCIVERALARAGVNSVCKGSHLFRHTEMLRHGASLGEIGHVLRHRHPDTTRIYAKVDLCALRRLAVPWPGGVRFSSYTEAIEDYLALRRSLGFKLRSAGPALRDFAAFLDREQAPQSPTSAALGHAAT
jgi:integrase/recombinase XerD